MFDIPDAKRVRRSDLYTRSQSSSPQPSEPDPELEAQLQARLASLFGSSVDISAIGPASQPTLTPNGEPQLSSEAPPNEEEPPEFEFRLFSTGKNDTRETQKIVLQVEEERVGEGGFVVPKRNPKYYFAEKAVGEQKWRFEVAALTGQEVLELSKRRAWGLEVPWRVTVLKTSRKSKGAATTTPQNDQIALDVGDEAKRKRPGKKRRVILRQRKKRKDELEEKKKKEKELKDETEREKRTRRNREKKVKKKMKEKAKKAEGAVGDAPGIEATDVLTASVVEEQEPLSE